MKGDFTARPQSKSFSNQVRPTSIYSKPGLASSYFSKGKEYQSQSSFQKAIEQYLKALMQDPNYFQAYCNMGSCYRSQEKYLQAKSMYQKAIAIKKDDPISHYNLANTLRIIGNYEDSIRHYQFVISLAQNGAPNVGSLFANSLINLGICYKQKQEYEKSIQCFEKAKKIDPKDESIIFNEAMTYMAILQKINTDLEYQVAIEHANAAEKLLRQVIKSDPKNQMALIRLNRISIIQDKSNKNLNLVASKLGEMLKSEECVMKNQINQELGYVLNLLKDYEKSASHYQESILTYSQKSINIYEPSIGSISKKQAQLTQQQAILQINEGKIDKVSSYIAKLSSDNITKHVLQLAIQLYLFETKKQSELHFNRAIDIYENHFILNNKEIPDEKLSLQAHKVIANLLSRQNKFKQSIRHFEYISSQIKNNSQRSKIRSSLGNDYESLGDKEKALEQYQLALAEQPENYEIMYNIGCCLHNEGNFQESKKYFEKFLALIKKDNKIYLPVKHLYIADCLTTLALSQDEGYETCQRAWIAIKQFKQGQKQSQQQTSNEFQVQKLLSFYLKWAELLEQKLMNSVDKKSSESKQIKETLLETYMELLQIPTCPDRDAILSNCAIVYYEQKLYVCALANLIQIAFPTSLSLNTLALVYFNLGQHIMASNFISKAWQKDPYDQLINFNKEVMQWVYGLEKHSILQESIDNQNEDLVIARWQYGILLIDAFSENLKRLQDQNYGGKISKITSKLLKGNQAQKYLSQIDKIKFKNLLSHLQKKRPKSLSFEQISSQILSKSLKKSQNIKKDLKQLVKLLQNYSEASETILQLLLNLFIFVNRTQSQQIKYFLQDYCSTPTRQIEIQLDKKIKITKQDRTKHCQLLSIEDLVYHLCSWECQLETKTVQLIQIIEQSYYKCNFRYPLEIEYQFPRHLQLNQCNVTFNKLLSIVYAVLKVKQENRLQPGSIAEMKKQLISFLDMDIESRAQTSSSNYKLSLQKDFTIATLYANFETRQECYKFVQDLQKLSSQQSLQIDYSNQQLIIIVSNILTISCCWTKKKSLTTAIKSLLKSPLELYLQSIIQIDSILQSSKDSSPKAKEILEKANQSIM